MNLKSALIITLIAVAWMMASCTRQQTENRISQDRQDTAFYSREAREVEVQFSAAFISRFKSMEEYQLDAESNFRDIQDRGILRSLLFLQGPIANRGLASIKTEQVKIISGPWMSKSGFLAFAYEYSGTWMLHNSAVKAFELPIPYNIPMLKTEKWLRCTDQRPEHKNDSFYWYYWDPARPGCDHKQGQQYQVSTVSFKETSGNEVLSFHDYERLFKSTGQPENMQMTFAFGYIKDVENPDPFKDKDGNMQNFQKFLEQVRVMARASDFVETPILLGEYLEPSIADFQIGSRFVGSRNGKRFEVKVVASANIDQMQIFAQSFAHDHDAFFSWMGHSRVGSEYDLKNFSSMVEENPDYYSISKEYQIVYWAGCTSYTYYTNLLFKLKAALDPELDPKGTKSLDVVSNGHSSPFSVFAENATTWLGALINWDMRASYQKIVSELEQSATNRKTTVLVNVLGDEDNPRPSKFQ